MTVRGADHTGLNGAVDQQDLADTSRTANSRRTHSFQVPVARSQDGPFPGPRNKPQKILHNRSHIECVTFVIPAIELEISTRETTGNSPNTENVDSLRGNPQVRRLSEERHADPSGNGTARPRATRPMDTAGHTASSTSQGVASVVYAPGRRRK